MNKLAARTTQFVNDSYRAHTHRHQMTVRIRFKITTDSGRFVKLLDAVKRSNRPPSDVVIDGVISNSNVDKQHELNITYHSL